MTPERRREIAKNARYRSLPSCASDHALLPRYSRRRARSTLADAIDPRDWRIYRDFANPLIETARELDVNDDFGVDLANTVDARRDNDIAGSPPLPDIDGLYNPVRRHLALDFLSSAHFEKREAC
jgi:hypothetical protein